MGDPKKQKKKYSKPSHPWQKERIVEEAAILREYGLKNKKEVWKMRSLQRTFAKRAKELIALKGQQAEIEKQQLLSKLRRLGLIQQTAQLDDILSLDIKDVLERRLQTQVFKKNLARSMNQARQFIVHNHIVVGERKISSPSYIVPLSEETQIGFVSNSPFSDLEHPERIPVEKKEKGKKAKESAQEETIALKEEEIVDESII